ncbi:MAG: prolipoprotein diacylglyceryl transferase [Sporolactobacillus sp.]
MTNTIEPISRVAFQIGSFSVYWYGVIIATGALLGLLLAIHEGKRCGLHKDTYVDLMLFAAPISIVFARAYYVIFEWSYFSKHLSEIIDIRTGGIAIYGSLIGAVATTIVFCVVRRIPFWKIVDIGAPSVILGQAIGRWGNFMNQEAHGGPTTRAALETMHLPRFIINQMCIDGTYYIPTFLYESLWDFAGFVMLLIVRRFNLKRGELFMVYVIWYALGRSYIEGLRTDSLMLGSLRVSQGLAVLLVFIGAALIAYWQLRQPNRPRYND